MKVTVGEIHKSWRIGDDVNPVIREGDRAAIIKKVGISRTATIVIGIVIGKAIGEFTACLLYTSRCV